MSTVRVSKPKNDGTSGSGLSSFLCAHCKQRHAIGVYVVAQCAMGHRLTHTCPCGQKSTVQSAGKSYRVTAHATHPTSQKQSAEECA